MYGIFIERDEDTPLVVLGWETAEAADAAQQDDENGNDVVNDLVYENSVDCFVVEVIITDDCPFQLIPAKEAN